MTKTIFITGASSGLGKASALLFAKNGWKVIATMRNPKNETELDKVENITLLPLDVTNLEQIDETNQGEIERFLTHIEDFAFFNQLPFSFQNDLKNRRSSAKFSSV